MHHFPQIKKIIAVASGKGGVGKSTVALNLAAALMKNSAKVGLLDADIYGPSQPTLLGTMGMRPQIENKTIQPIVRHGLLSMSIGYLVDGKTAMMWRGPMLGKALEQLIHDTAWGELDYLVIDLPPGTGDVQLTLCQKIPVDGAVIVTTPQDLALLDVRRACEMFIKLNVPILGVIENMSAYHCSQCGHVETIFGEGGAAKVATQFALKLLASIPLHQRIRELSDQGEPPVLAEPDSSYAQLFIQAAKELAVSLISQKKPDAGHAASFPKIVVVHDKK